MTDMMLNQKLQTPPRPNWSTQLTVADGIFGLVLMLTAVHQIRKEAAAVIGQSTNAYLIALFYGLMARLQTYDPKIHHTQAELLPYFQALLLAACLSERWQAAQPKPNIPPEAETGLWLDFSKHEVWVEGKPVELSPTEYRLLAYLYENQNRLCGHIEIAEQVFAEKVRKIQKQLDKLNEFRTLSETRISNIEDRLKRIEEMFDKLQLSILDKIGSYGRNVSNMKKEMEMMQDLIRDRK